MNFIKPLVAFVLTFVVAVYESTVEHIARHKRKRIGTVASNDNWNPQPTRASRNWRTFGFGFTVFSIFFTIGSIFAIIISLIYHLL